MHEFSTADGFVEITESLAEMIKYIANEPSVGLYYIQQHTQNAVPNVINLKNNVLERSRETVLHTEDLEDSITMVRSMKECGFPIADEMIGDIKSSLAVISAKQPKRGLIQNASPWEPSTSFNGSDYARDGESSSYFSSVFKSAKQRASNLKWPHLDFKDQRLEQNKEKQLERIPILPLSVAPVSTSSSVDSVEVDEMPASSEVVDEVQKDLSLSPDKIHLVSDNYDEFKADREAKLKAWLADTDRDLDGDKLSA